MKFIFWGVLNKLNMRRLSQLVLMFYMRSFYINLFDIHFQYHWLTQAITFFCLHHVLYKVALHRKKNCLYLCFNRNILPIVVDLNTKNYIIVISRIYLYAKFGAWKNAKSFEIKVSLKNVCLGMIKSIFKELKVIWGAGIWLSNWLKEAAKKSFLVSWPLRGGSGW